jgi:transcriptional regulator with XRE-family HTH domain
MNAQFDIEEIVEIGYLRNELEYERALIADRKLRMLAKSNARLKPIRERLRDIIEKYEKKNWSPKVEIDDDKLRESELAELIAEKERQFLQRRKELIKEKLKAIGLTQQQLGEILGHKSKTYMSELMNGIVPFGMNDLIIIHRLLKINMKYLMPTTLSQPQRTRIKKTLSALGNKKLKLSADDFDIVV